jgi:hypothetical protein
MARDVGYKEVITILHNDNLELTLIGPPVLENFKNKIKSVRLFNRTQVVNIESASTVLRCHVIILHALWSTFSSANSIDVLISKRSTWSQSMFFRIL